MNRCVIYCRVSTEGQKDNYSLPEQERMCLERAQERGYEIVQIVKEDYSGAKIDRPGMSQVLDLAHDSAFDVLLISDLDRFAREPEVKILLKREFINYGIHIEYVLKEFSKDASGELMEDILTAFASHERKVITSRMSRGRKSRAQAGYVTGTGTPAYGFLYVKEERKGRLELHKDEANIVRLIYSLCVSGKGVTAIARELNDMGIRTRKGKLWDPGTISTLLRNEAYIGIYYFGKKRIRNSVKANKEGWIPIEVPAIIECAVFEEAQRLLDQRQKTHQRNQKEEYLLGGRITCAVCNKAFVGNIARPSSTLKNGEKKVYHSYPNYRCYGATPKASVKHEKTCVGYVRRELIDDVVWSYVYGLLSDPDRMAEAVLHSQSKNNDERGRLQSRLDVLGEEIEKINNQRERLIDIMIDADEIAIAAMRQRLKTLGDTQKSLENERSRTQDGVDKTPKHINFEEVRAFCETILAHELSFNGKRRVLEVLDIQVVVNKPEGWFSISGRIPYVIMSLDGTTSVVPIKLIKVFNLN